MRSFLFELLGLALFVGACAGACCCFSHNLSSAVPVGFLVPFSSPGMQPGLGLRGGLLLVGHRVAGTLAGTSVGVRTLSANGQAAAMTIAPPIRANLDQPLDVHRDVFTKVAFNRRFVLDIWRDAIDFIFAEVLNFLERLERRPSRDRSAPHSPMP